MSWRPQKSCKDKLTTSDGLSIPGEKRHIGHAHLAMIGTSLGDGLFPVKEAGTSTLINENGLVVALDPACMKVAVHDFVAISDGFIIGHKWLDKNRIAATKTLSAADPTNPRIDAIIIATTEDDLGKIVHDNEAVDANVLVIEGTPAAEPERPALEPGQILVACITVGAGVTEITDDDIDTNCRDFLKDIDDDVCKAIGRIVEQNTANFSRIRRRFADQEARITELENAGGGGSLTSLISPIDFTEIGGAGPNELASVTGHDPDALPVVTLAKVPGTFSTVFNETWNPDNPPVSYAYGSSSNMFAMDRYVIGSGDAGGEGAKMSVPVGAFGDAFFGGNIFGFQGDPFVTGTFKSDFTYTESFYTDIQLSENNGGPNSLNFNWSYFEEADNTGVPSGGFPYQTIQGFMAIDNADVPAVQFVVDTLITFDQLVVGTANFAYFGPLPFSMPDVAGRPLRVKVDCQNWMRNVTCELIYDTGSGEQSFSIPLTNLTPLVDDPLPNDLTTVGSNNFGQLTGLNVGQPVIGIVDTKIEAMSAPTYTGPAIVTTTDVETADKLITAYLAGDFSAPDGTSVVFEINRGGGFEPVDVNVLDEFDGASTGGTVVLKVTLDTTNAAITPSLRGMTLNSDDATRQADLKALADKYDAVIDKIVADGGHGGTITAADKINLA